ncbi:MAG: DUF4097 family beta strand repeat protein [Clostridia bacterium]|nr:DUF4097 family beta strand repeat protein [Clostridia bacterium]
MSSKLEILKMIESGKISVEQGLELIEALEQTERIEGDIRDESEVYEKETDRIEQSVMMSFDVALTTCKINIERSNVDDVTIELFDDKTRELVAKPEWLHFYEEEHYISIKETRVTNLTDIFDFFKSGSGSMSPIFINVKVPMEYDVDRGKFSTVSGNISMIGLRAIDLEAKSVSGKIVATDLKAKVIQLKSTSGNVIADNVKAARIYLNSTSGKVKSSGIYNKVESKTISGNIEIDGGENLDEITLSSVSGKVSVYVPEPEMYNLFFDSVSGSMDTSGFAVVDKNIAGKKHISIDNRSDHRTIKINTISGKILLDKK